LDSFLIMPVQRLPRYLLLLKELIKEIHWNTKKELTTIYLLGLRQMIIKLNLQTIQFFKTLLPAFFELFNFQDASNSEQICDTFKVLIENCWIRIPAHREKIEKALIEAKTQTTDSKILERIDQILGLISVISESLRVIHT